MLTLLEDEDKTVEGYGIEDMQQILLEGKVYQILSILLGRGGISFSKLPGMHCYF